MNIVQHTILFHSFFVALHNFIACTTFMFLIYHWYDYMTQFISIHSTQVNCHYNKVRFFWFYFVLICNEYRHKFKFAAHIKSFYSCTQPEFPRIILSSFIHLLTLYIYSIMCHMNYFLRNKDGKVCKITCQMLTFITRKI